MKLQDRTIVFAFLFFVAFSFSCSSSENKRRSAEAPQNKTGFLSRLFRQEPPSIPVTVGNVSLQERSSLLRFSGTLEPSKTSNISLPADAYVENVLVDLNTNVEAGERVLQLSEDEINIQLSQARAKLLDVQGKNERTQYLFQNKDDFLLDGKLDQSDYDDLESKLSLYEKETEELQLKIQALEAQTENTFITSPQSGIIKSISASPRSKYEAGKTLIEIVSIDPILVSFRLPAYEAESIKIGQELRVKTRGLPGEAVRGKISSIGTELRAADNTFEAKAEVPNTNSALKIGDEAMVELVSSKKKQFFAIPAESILSIGSRHYVYTVIKGKAHQVRVVPRETYGDMTEIAEGLREDDLIIIKGQEQVSEGTSVNIWGR
ncbi:MAG: hypothetical protein COX62_06520 [Deltaproteobacteria bacterium CG_4_10_14_0_2_um_filter_43_8]|nr:MAG: hypothetical protein COV43_07465 [Deltaproteobacteria bacterium CG11_big_fil_rev_8_21_14_0_20_42_23]PJA19569.1 MAG: hypothetical protein COX62_06520 [Deltaproteobacteria bacterium CG_4_10_14_0_2_um_filter_43_8]PJC63944.1 MAG: hypothetical protein CO021_06960 [Deltaproteobacteria bacterium CG_4_9_14_0_2_um_filter_42_21]